MVRDSVVTGGRGVNIYIYTRYRGCKGAAIKHHCWRTIPYQLGPPEAEN